MGNFQFEFLKTGFRALAAIFSEVSNHMVHLRELHTVDQLSTTSLLVDEAGIQ